MSRRYHLTLAEQETVINWDNELDIASVYTHDMRLIHKLKELAEKYPEQFILERKGPQRAVTYTVPKKCVGIRPPYGEARRQKDIENAKIHGLPFLKPEQEQPPEPYPCQQREGMERCAL